MEVRVECNLSRFSGFVFSIICATPSSSTAMNLTEDCLPPIFGERSEEWGKERSDEQKVVSYCAM